MMSAKPECNLPRSHLKPKSLSANCPILLVNEETVSVLDPLLNTLRSGGFSPLSLRELFRCRRGVSALPELACVIVLRGISEKTLRGLLPLLDSYRYPIMLFTQTFYSVKMYAELKRYPFMFLFVEARLLEETDICFFPQEIDSQTAVISDRIDMEYLAELRKQGVRMVLTEQEIKRGELPSGLDVLPLTAVSGEWSISTLRETCFQQEDASSALYLPMGADPLFSDPTLAVPLSILGADVSRFCYALACSEWYSAYSDSEDRYTMHAKLFGLHEKSVTLHGESVSAFRAYLRDGWYIRLQTDAFRVPCQAAKGGWFAPGSLLLYGYDDTCGTFAAMTAISPGAFDRVDLMTETLARLCESGTVTLLTPNDDVPVVDLKKLDRQMQIEEQLEPSKTQPMFFGWKAAVRYANRFCSRLAAEHAHFSADSVRTFLEERLLYGMLLRFCTERVDLYIEALDSHCEVLEKEVKLALHKLRGKETLSSDISLLLLCNLMRKVLITEEACRLSLSEEIVRAERRAEYLREKDAFAVKNA